MKRKSSKIWNWNKTWDTSRHAVVGFASWFKKPWNIDKRKLMLVGAKKYLWMENMEINWKNAGAWHAESSEDLDYLTWTWPGPGNKAWVEPDPWRIIQMMMIQKQAGKDSYDPDDNWKLLMLPWCTTWWGWRSMWIFWRLPPEAGWCLDLSYPSSALEGHMVPCKTFFWAVEKKWRQKKKNYADGRYETRVAFLWEYKQIRTFRLVIFHFMWQSLCVWNLIWC